MLHLPQPSRLILSLETESDSSFESRQAMRQGGKICPPFDSTSKTVHGHPSGTARDVEETLHFAALNGIRPMTETRPLDEVQTAYDRMLSGDVRYRMVLTTDG